MEKGSWLKNEIKDNCQKSKYKYGTGLPNNPTCRSTQKILYTFYNDQIKWRYTEVIPQTFKFINVCKKVYLSKISM